MRVMYFCFPDRPVKGFLEKGGMIPLTNYVIKILLQLKRLIKGKTALSNLILNN